MDVGKVIQVNHAYKFTHSHIHTYTDIKEQIYRKIMFTYCTISHQTDSRMNTQHTLDHIVITTTTITIHKNMIMMLSRVWSIYNNHISDIKLTHSAQYYNIVIYFYIIITLHHLRYPHWISTFLEICLIYLLISPLDSTTTEDICDRLRRLRSFATQQATARSRRTPSPLHLSGLW